jgi:hypothetical protein
MATATPSISPGIGQTRRPVVGAVLVTAIVAAAAVFFYFVNPSSVVFLPRCPLYMRTGLYCPGCGATRAVHEILHGHWQAALRLNALFTLSLPCLAVFVLYRWAGPRWGWSAKVVQWRPYWTWLLAAVIVVFGVVRNIPVYPFTLLIP